MMQSPYSDISSTSAHLDLSFESDERKWQAIVQRNPLAKGYFVYGVNSTKVFCQPICPARLPRRSNVVFFPTPWSALSAGFRPCLRCRPESNSSTRTALITKACRSIEKNKKISLDELANESN